jgi:O-antigen/teichoic acid export membrane protein
MKIPSSSVLKSLFANFFGVGVQLFNQIVLIPLYLHFWTTGLYGDWIILTAISSFFAMSDVGLNSVTINQFVIKFTEGNYDECKSLLTNNYVLIFFIFCLSLLLCSFYLLHYNIVNSLGLHFVNREVGSYVFIILTCQIFLDMASSVLDAIYRAVSLNHKSVYISNLARLSEALVIVFALVFHLSLPVLVSIYIVPRCISFAYKSYDTKQYFRYRFSFKFSNWVLFKKVLTPSITFMSFPLGHAIIFQGFSLLVNKYFGANSLVLYNTTRTLSNFIKTLLDTLQQAVWPEYSIAYGKNDIVRMRNLHRKAFVVATAGSVLLSICILLTGKYIYAIWTNHKIVFDASLMLAFLVVLICRNVWVTSSVSLMATNQHSVLGIFYIFSAFISIGLAFIFYHSLHSLALTVYCQLLVEVSLSIYALHKGIKMTNDTFYNLLGSYKIVFHEYKKLFLK